jgi:hypothetical protein
MKSIEITPDALALAAYISNAVRDGRDAEAREAGGQLLEATTLIFAFPRRKRPFLSAYQSFKTE